MITEKTCLAIVQALHGRVSTYTERRNLGEGAEEEAVRENQVEHALADGHLVRPLLRDYELADIDASIRWLRLGSYLSKTQWGMGGPWVHVLTEKGVALAEAGQFSEEDRAFFYQEEPHTVFVAHQFSEEDESLTEQLCTALTEQGYRVVDGNVDGLAEFRHDILAKIRRPRFFVCLLTRRAKLVSGEYASSVWLYQEIGAAVAAGKAPLLLVEDGLADHYAGELQSTYEYIPFERGSFDETRDRVLARLGVDLDAHNIPRPSQP